MVDRSEAIHRVSVRYLPKFATRINRLSAVPLPPHNTATHITKDNRRTVFKQDEGGKESGLGAVKKR